jgi:hypothetical protein
MMMGDNVNNSHDSRAWREQSFTLRDGLIARFEEQELMLKDLSSYKAESMKARERWMQQHGLSEPPDYFIVADQYGHEHGLSLSDVRDEGRPKPSPFVHRKFLVGKALWVWWPPPSWFRLIR